MDYYVFVFKNHTALETAVSTLRQRGVYVESVWNEDNALVTRTCCPKNVGGLLGVKDCIKRKDFESGFTRR